MRRALAARLQAAGGESAELDARILVEAVANTAPLDPFASLDETALARLEDYARRRLGGEPVWRILGEREFWGLPFRLSPATLEPRPDSETLIDAALEVLAGRRHDDLSVLDLGTGTGCLLIAVLSEFPRACGLGIDLSPEACATARENARANDVADRARFAAGNWAGGLDGVFDLILSNPPYIPAGEIPGLAPAVRDHDPRRALDGGADGLDPYRLFAGELPRLLAPGGNVILEIGAGQEAQVVSLIEAGGLVFRGARRDLGGHPRALIFVRERDKA